MYPKISIVTPSLNQGQYIEENIRSVIDQNYPNVEHIIIDGGSKDNTLEILKKYDPFLNWVSEPDRGQSHAVNKGFKRATGDIIGWVNSDDKLSSGALNKISEFFTSHPESFSVVGDLILIRENGDYVKTIRGFIHDYQFITMKAGGVIQPSTFFKRCVFQQIGYLDETFHYNMDYDFFIRLSSIGNIEYLPYTLAVFRLHDESKTKRNMYQFMIETLHILKKYNLPILQTVAGRSALYTILTEPLRQIPFIREFVRKVRKTNDWRM